MKIVLLLKRSVAAALLTAGLAYPVCAAVCPKGIGGCPSPGRCFLFTDADKNALCDYTSRAGSQTASGASPSGPGTPATVQSTVQAPASPLPDPATIPATAAPAPPAQAVAVSPTVSPAAGTGTLNETAAAASHTPSGGGLFETLHLAVPLAGVLLFLVLTGIFFVLIRTGIAGTQVRKTGPALALSAFFGIGASLIVTCILADGAVAGTIFALIWMGSGTLLAAYLWYAGVTDRRFILAAATMSTLAGFVFLAPIMPMELGGIVNVLTGTSVLTAGVLVICAVVLLALGPGRTFCGQVCPVGSLQEMAYEIPTPKFVVRHAGVLELIRFAIFAAAVVAAIFLIDLMAYTGLYDLFSLTLSAGFAIAAGLVLVSVFLYRPVCRVLCPFGVLFSLFAGFSFLRIRRTERCISCKKCEKACPARAAGRDDPKRECYLCARCKQACPVSGALVYSR